MTAAIFTLIGGMGIFIYGMLQMSDGLQKLAGSRIRKIIRSLTDNRFKGILLGGGVTSIVQSSSITTVMLVGLLNAGIMTLPQAIGVVYGANIGTTITAQIIAFNISKYALPMIAIGLLMNLIPHSRKVKFVGQVMLALGFVFLGLKFMKDACAPMRESETIMHFMASLSQHPILAILCGIALTVAVQSSSASIGLTIALASSGLIDFTAALYILLGDNIGTTVTAWLASIGGAVASRRMALVHTLFNVIGASYFIVLISSGFYINFIDRLTPGPITPDTIARNIANAHTVFNIFNAIVLFPLIGVFAWLAAKVFSKDDHVHSGETKFIDEHLIDTPEVAIDQVRMEIHHMATIAKDSFITATEGFLNKDRKAVKRVERFESAVDSLQQDITRYLVKVYGRAVSPDISNRLPSLLHSINDVEKIGDHSENIASLITKQSEQNIPMTAEATKELKEIYDQALEMFEGTLALLHDGDIQRGEMVLMKEGVIDGLKKRGLANHIERLKNRTCHPLAGLVFVDFLNNIEKIGDHLTNVIQAAITHYAYDRGKLDEPPAAAPHPTSEPNLTSQ